MSVSPCARKISRNQVISGLTTSLAQEITIEKLLINKKRNILLQKTF